MAGNQDTNLPSTGHKPKIGFGLFLLLAGFVMLGQRAGWVPPQFDWFIPAVLLAWGASELYRQLR